MQLDACLPVDLRGPATTITKLAAGLSGAGVYRVEAGGDAYVLKIAEPTEPVEAWRRKVDIQRLAAGAGIAPRVVHADAERRAVVSAFVVDRSFPALWMNPQTRDFALALLARTVRRLHELPVPAGARAIDARGWLAELSASLAMFALPAFARDAIERVLAEPPPAAERAPVLCHNDLNPSNLAFDGERLLLLDWNTAAPNDPLYDLATLALFLRMDDATCRQLLAAYDAAPAGDVPARFRYLRRLVAALCGAMGVTLARAGGHPGARDAERRTLVDFYAQLRAGAVSLATTDGQWQFALALLDTI